jgi:hypothetical protein
MVPNSQFSDSAESIYVWYTGSAVQGSPFRVILGNPERFSVHHFGLMYEKHISSRFRITKNPTRYLSL